MPRVEYTDPNGVQREATIKGVVRIGRHPNQDLQILDRVVSKAHAVIEIRDEGVAVAYDAGSRNGTIVNGELIQGERILRDKDEITVGSTTLVFHADESRRERLKSKVTILEEGYEASVRKRLRDTGNPLFLHVEQIDDVGQLRDDYEKLRIANELNQALTAEFEQDRLMNRILEKAIDMFGADCGVIFLVDNANGELEPAAMRVKRDDPGGIRLSRTILREVVEEKAAVLSSNAALDERFGGAQSIIMQGIKSTMSVPLLYRDKLLGVIHLDSRVNTGAFTGKDLSLLSGFANQAANAIEHTRVVDQLKKEALAREQLGRLLSPEMVDDVVNGKLEIRRGGVLRNASVLFADIRGFTAMSERHGPQEIVAMLNEYFEIMVEIIFRHGGTLDKFIGDEIMAVWGAPIAIDDHCGRAVRAALDMDRAITEYNQTRVSEGLEAIRMGIGINTGEVVAGFMGSSKAMDHTVIGDVVNTASRFCSHAAPGQIIVGPAVMQSLEGAMDAEPLPPATLKGKSEPVPVFRVRGLR
jgi:adenylate cyclase